MTSGPRLVGVDYGTKRVGLAVSDPLRLFTRPHGTFPPNDALAELRAIAARDGIERIVVGWPLTPEGEAGAATRFVEPFVNRLRKAFPQVDVVTWDERFTSARAKAAIREAGVRRKGRRDKGRVDAAAAALILQDYLDAHGA